MSAVAGNAVSQVVAGRYRLNSLIGTGGMGWVYRAHDELIRRDVAVKVFRAEQTRPEDALRQEREIRMLSVLAHPSLTILYDAGHHDFEGGTRRFIVIELVDGPSLSARMDSGPLLPDEVAVVGTQIAEALAYVHGKGVVHRDVKPGNILISGIGSGGFDRTAKLTDFGIARFVDGSRLTADGNVIGTAGYLSPEQVLGHPVSASSDVYSLGLVLLEALTGVREFPGSVVESAVARVNRDPEVPAHLPEEWRTLLLAMTARDPLDRPAADTVATALRALSRPVGSALSTSGELALADARRRSRLQVLRTAWQTLGVVALVVASFWAGALLT